MRKRKKSNLIRNFFDGRKFRRQCANVIDTTWGRIYFLTCENFRRKFRTQCAETFIAIGCSLQRHTEGASYLNPCKANISFFNILLLRAKLSSDCLFFLSVFEDLFFNFFLETGSSCCVWKNPTSDSPMWHRLSNSISFPALKERLSLFELHLNPIPLLLSCSFWDGRTCGVAVFHFVLVFPNCSDQDQDFAFRSGNLLLVIPLLVWLAKPLILLKSL